MFYQNIEKFVGETFTKKGNTPKTAKSRTQMVKLLKKGNFWGPKQRRPSGKRKSVYRKKIASSKQINSMWAAEKENVQKCIEAEVSLVEKEQQIWFKKDAIF